MMMRTRIGLGFIVGAVSYGGFAAWPVVSARQQGKSSSPSIAVAEGRTTTVLADGRLLLLGGQSSGGVLGTGAIVDPRSGATTPLTGSLAVPRADHTATLLPDGTVLIVGGHRAFGQLAEVAEVFDPDTGAFLPFGVSGAIPRAGHTATVLTDGRVMIAGGTATGERPMTEIEVWDVPRQRVSALSETLNNARTGHTATLLPDGRVLISGGVDAAGHRVERSEIVDTSRQRVTGSVPTPDDDTPVRITESVPANDATDVPLEIRIAVRVSKPLRSETINTRTVTLTGDDGPVEATVVPTEGGRLVFVSPRTPLRAGMTHTLSLVGVSDPAGVRFVGAPVTFVTRREARGTPDAADPESWTPDATGPNGWNSGRPDSPWIAMPPLQAPLGATAVAGQVLRLDGQPLPDVTLTIEGQSARSDRTGRFLVLASVPTGEHTLVIDARTASRGRRTYGFYEARITLKAGVTTALPFVIWSPLLDTAHTITIPSPTTTELVVITPTMPGLELHLPAGTVIRDEAGRVVRQLTMTPIPLDRPPFPLPVDATFTMDFTIQPGGAYVSTPGPIKGAWLVYPNINHSPVGKRVQFFNYDPDDKGWFVYGMGTVGATAVRPDAKTRFYAFTGASFNDGNSPPLKGPTQPKDPRADPVDPSTGIFSMQKTDLYLSDVIPLELTRSYNSADAYPRPFGTGMTHAYAIFQHSEHQFDEGDLILADGGKIHFVRISADGLPWYSTVLECQAAPTGFYKARITFNGNDWDMTRTDGTVYVFGHTSGLQTIRDRYGNEVRLTWSAINAFGDGTGNVMRVTSPSGRWISFTYDTSNRITQAKDNIGRTVSYAYDASGNLSTVTDPANNVTTYTYDGSKRMLTIKDGRGIVYLTNQYDASGRVSQQTLADPSAMYHFAYTTDGSGNITQTDVTDPRNHTERLLFNSNRYVMSDAQAFGTSLARSTTTERQTGSNFVTATVDGLNRRTAYTYDASGHALTVTRLAGTANAVTTTITYEPKYGQVATTTDPLGHTATLTYDAGGGSTGMTDPLGHHGTVSLSGAGQVTSLTDPLGHAWQFGYSGGDRVSTTNPLGAVWTQFVDAAGRVRATTDPLGRATRTTTDTLDRPTSVIDPLGGQTSLSYDANSNMLSLTDAQAHTTSYTYDSGDRVSTLLDPVAHLAAYQYDANGNLTQTTDRKSQVTSRAYDVLDRLTQVTFTDSATVAYTYDAGDRLTQIVDSANGTITRTYDDLDRLTAETTPQGTVNYTFDADGRRTTMTVTGQTAVSYTYDAAHRVTAITQGPSAVLLTYDDANRRSTLTFPNGIVATYGYDNANQLTGLTHTMGATTLGDLTYTYDQAGSRTSVGGAFARTGLPQALANITYDGANRLAASGSTAFSYDLNGNLTSDGTTTYTWNTRNQLTALSGSASASFAYDGTSRRRGKTVSGTTTNFLYDGLNVVQELSGTTPTANLLTGLGIDETFTRAMSGGTSMPLIDSLGSTLALADASGTLQTQYTFEPFGATSVSGAASANAAQFTGRENDGTGLYFSRVRFYSPALQRFLSEDPLGPVAGLNLYGYVNENPTNQTDRLGLAPDSWFECWAKCIERRRWDLPFPMISAWPKQLLPPFTVVDQMDRLTTPLSSLMYLMRDIIPDDFRFFLRRQIGRPLSFIGTPLTLGEGFWDWYVILDCAKKCRGCR